MANVTGWFAEVSAGVTAPRMTAAAVMNPPTVSSVSPFVVAPARMSASGVMKVPALTFSTTLAAPRMAATGAMAVPAISNAVNVSLTAPRMTATGSLAIPSVGVLGSITAPRMAAAAALAVPVVNTINGSTFSDNFNRSDSSTLGASWNTDSTIGASLTIASNAAIALGTGANIYATTMATGNNEITLVMKGTPTTGDIVIVLARMDNATDSGSATKFVEAYLEQGAPWTLYRAFSDSTGVSSPGNESWAAGNTIVFSCVGGTLTIKRNGSTVLTTSGATDLAAGYVDLLVVSSSANVGFDSFTAQDI